MVQIVPRSAWGARHAAGAGARSLPTAECWLHHSVTLAPDLAFTDLDANGTDDDEAAAMRSIESIGQQRFRQGFSYNLAVMPSGRVYEGCGIGRVGAHTGGRNTKAMGIVLVGNYEASPLPQPMRDVLPVLLRDLHAARQIDAPRFDGGHRDLKRTSCPGINAYREIGAINAEAVGGKGAAPAPAPRPAPAHAVAVAPPFPLPGGWYFGPKSGPRESVSGYYQRLPNRRPGHSGLLAWQDRMAGRGWKIGVDGLYGANTAEIARKFQAEKHLGVDGLIGARTWAAAWAAPVT